MKDYGKEFKSNRADAASILTSFVTGVDGCNDILKDDSDIEAKLQSLKVKIPDYRDCTNNNEKIAAWKIALIEPMLEADAYKTFMKSEKQQVKDTRRLVDGFQLERGLKLNKHLFDDFDTVELKITGAGQIGFFVKSNMKSEKARKTLLLNAIKIHSRKSLPRQELDVIRKLAQKNKAECKARLLESIKDLDIKVWQKFKSNCETTDCAIIRFLDKQRGSCNGFLRSTRELSYVTPDLEIQYSMKKLKGDKLQTAGLDKSVKKVLKNQVERFLCDERVAKDGSLLKDSEEVKRRVLEKLKQRWELRFRQLDADTDKDKKKDDSTNGSTTDTKKSDGIMPNRDLVLKSGRGLDEDKEKKKDDSTDGSTTDTKKSDGQMPNRRAATGDEEDSDADDATEEDKKEDAKKVKKGPKKENKKTIEKKPDLLRRDRALLGVSMAGNEVLESLAGDARMLTVENDREGDTWLDFVYTEEFEPKNVLEQYGWHGFNGVDLDTGNISKISHNNLKYKCRKAETGI
jgi:hypothetical protein